MITAVTELILANFYIVAYMEPFVWYRHDVSMHMKMNMKIQVFCTVEKWHETGEGYS